MRDREQQFILSRFAPMDGTALDDDGLATAISAMPPGGRLVGGGLVLKLSRKRVIDKLVNLDLTGVTVVQPANAPAFELTPSASGSTLVAGTWTNETTVYGGNAKMIHLLGSPGNPVRDVNIAMPNFSQLASSAVWGEFCEDVTVFRPTVRDAGYAAAIFRSSKRCHVVDPRIDTLEGVTVGAVKQSYGVAFTRDSTKPIDTHPVSSDCSVIGGTIENTGGGGAGHARRTAHNLLGHEDQAHPPRRLSGWLSRPERRRHLRAEGHPHRRNRR